MELTAQQKEILDQAKLPFEAKESSLVGEGAAVNLVVVRRDEAAILLVCITAAAGTGKTITLVNLAERLKDVGHTQITFVTFCRSSASDAEAKMNAMGLYNEVDAKTIHACAISSLDNMIDATDSLNDGGNYPFLPEDDSFVIISGDIDCDRHILAMRESDILTFLEGAYKSIDLRWEIPQRMIRRSADVCKKSSFLYARLHSILSAVKQNR